MPDVEATAERVAGRVDDHDEPLMARARHRDRPAGDHEVDVLAPQGVEGRLGGRAEAGEEPMHVHIPQLVVPERGRVLEDRPFREGGDRFPAVGAQEFDDSGGISRMYQQVHVRTAAVLGVDAGLGGVALDMQAPDAGPVQQMRDAGVGEADADLEVQGRRGGRSLSRRLFPHGREHSRPSEGSIGDRAGAPSLECATGLAVSCETRLDSPGEFHSRCSPSMPRCSVHSRDPVRARKPHLDSKRVKPCRRTPPPSPVAR